MLEQEQNISGKIVLCIYPADKDHTNYRIQAVPVSDTTEFENRRPLPTEWRGLRDEVLQKAIGVDSAIFVHATGFIGGAKRREDAIKMADKTLSLPKGA